MTLPSMNLIFLDEFGIDDNIVKEYGYRWFTWVGWLSVNVFIPTYSPDLNPIEHFWFKIKNHVKKIQNEFENFIDAICYVLKKDTISMI